MIHNNKIVTQYLSDFNEFLIHLNGSNNPAVSKIRKQAISAFSEQGFPSTKDEDWRYTDLAPVLSRQFSLMKPAENDQINTQRLKEFLLPDWPGKQLMFVNGFYYPLADNDLSAANGGIHIRTLAEILRDDPALSKKYLGRHENAFSALNTAFLQDGVFIEFDDNFRAEQPLHLIFLSSSPNRPLLSHPRVIIVAGKNSKAQIIESHYSLEHGISFTNSITDIRLRENSSIDHVTIQNKNTESYYIGHVYAEQARDSVFNTLSLNIGGSTVRNSIYTKLAGNGSHCQMNGLYLGHREQRIDNHTTIEHAAPHCTSHELYQGILADKARGAFSGMILVKPDAQKTDAIQSNNCLLLSEQAHVDSKPQLEIYADDVKCTHGATVGQLDEQQIFYLQSRGVNRQKAKNILTYAFAERVIEAVQIPVIREQIDRLIAERFDEDMKFRLDKI